MMGFKPIDTKMSLLQSREYDANSDDTILVELFGKSPEIQVIDFFLDHPFNDFMQSELADRTGMNPRTIKRVLIKFESEDIIKINRRIGKAVLYKLNQRNPVVNQIKKLEEEASLQFAETQE